MNISLLQFDIKWGETKKNCDHAESLMRKHKETKLFVLPEMFSTGFCTNPRGYAEENEGYSFRWMQKMAKVFNSAVTGSVLTYEGDRFFNRLYFVYPNGEAKCYDKRHLFTFGGEDKYFTPGNDRVVVEYEGVRILLQVCYDLRFPIFSRNRNDYDLVIYVANWPESRINAWKILLKARAIENQCYVVGVNRVGDDPSCHYIGGTEFINSYGEALMQARDNEEDIVDGIIDINKLQTFRKHFPVLNDADLFELKNK